MNYKLSIWYAASADADPQVHILNKGQVYDYVRPEVGFMSDMLNLEGEGVRKLTLEVEKVEKPPPDERVPPPNWP